MGSGTTAVAAKKLGRNYIGIDSNQEYVNITEKRLKELDEIQEADFFSGEKHKQEKLQLGLQVV